MFDPHDQARSEARHQAHVARVTIRTEGAVSPHTTGEPIFRAAAREAMAAIHARPARSFGRLVASR